VSHNHNGHSRGKVRRFKGLKARELFVQRFGEEAYRKFTDVVKQTIDELSRA